MADSCGAVNAPAQAPARGESTRRRLAAAGRVTVTAEFQDVDGARLVFAFEALDDLGAVVGDGRIERAVVGRERFLSRFSR